jgi:hypothetical protein
MRHIAKDLAPRLWLQGRPSRGDTPQRQVARFEGRLQSTQKRPAVVVSGIVLQDLIEDALIAAILDCREKTARAIIECIGGHIPRKIS